MNAPAPSLPPVIAPSGRVTPSAVNAFGGVWRLTFRRFLMPGRWLMLAIGLAVLALLCVAAKPGNTRNNDYAEWSIEFYLTFLVPALAFIAAGGAMRDELKSGTVDYVLTRPIRRPAFLAFKYIAHMLCTQVDFLLALGVVLGFAAVGGSMDVAALAPKLLFGQLLLVAGFSALGFLAGTLTSRYVIIGLLYGLVIEVGVGQIPTQLSRLSMTQQMRELISALVFPLDPASATAPGAFATTVVLLAIAAGAIAIAAVIFSRRELSGPAD